MSCKYIKCCDGVEDGILHGRTRPPDHIHSTLVEVFKYEYNHKHIKGEKPAIVCGQSQMSFLELDHFSTAIALAVGKLIENPFAVTNPEEEIVIGVCLPTSEKLVAILFAILKLGAAFLPLDPIYPEDLLLSIIHKFRPIMVITDDDGPILGKYDAKSFGEFCKLLSLEELWMDMKLPSADDTQWKSGMLDKQIEIFSSPLNVEPHLRPAIVVHASGVAGDPQGVRVGHKAILNRCNWEWHEFSFTKKDASALTSPIVTVDAICILFTALLKGCTVNMYKRTEMINMTNLIHKFHEQGITRLYFYTHVIDKFLKAAKTLGRNSIELRQLKVVCCLGSDLIPTNLVQDFVNFFSNEVAIVKLYGTPETCGNTIYHRFKIGKDTDKKSYSSRVLIDRVMDNCSLYVLSNYLELTKDGNQGEICVAGDSIAMGFVDMKEEESTYRFLDNPHDDRKQYEKLFRTGDYGRIESVDGKRCLYIEGRFDDQIYYKGHQVSLNEMEELILLNDKVEEVETIIYNGFDVNKAMVGFVLPKEAWRYTLMAEEVRGALSNKIPEYLLPDIRIIEKVPIAGMNPIRVSQRQLVRIYEQERQSSFNNWGKLRLQDAKLAACKILLESMFKFAAIPVEKSSSALNSSFYELGGTSLNALSVLLQLNRVGCALKMRDFVGTKNLSALVDKMADVMALQNKVQAPPPAMQAKPGKDGDDNRDDVMMGVQVSSASMYKVETKDKYEVLITPKDAKKEVIDLMSRAYFEKGALERYNLVHYNEYYEYFSEIWDGLVASQLSIVVRRISDGKIVGGSFSQDYFTPTIEMSRCKSLHQLLEYAQELKGSVLHKVPHQKGVVFEIAWMGTHKSLSPDENIQIISMMMTENIRLAKTDGFSCVFILATSQFIQDLCIDILDFEILDEYPANKFKLVENLHPFRVAPATVTTSLCWLIIGRMPTPTQSMSLSALEKIRDKSESSISHVEYKQVAEMVARGEKIDPKAIANARNRKRTSS